MRNKPAAKSKTVPRIKPTTVHRKKLFDGRETAEDVFRSTLQDKCPCGLPAAMVVRIFMPLDEMIKRDVEGLVALAMQHGGQVPVIDFKHGKHVRTGMAYACEICSPTLEKEAAKAPSWAVVEINRGPGKDRPIVGVAR